MKKKIKMKKRLLLASLFAAAGVIPAAAQTTDVDELKSEMQQMQTNMAAMQQKINELEQEKAAAGATPGTNAVVITNANTEVIFATPEQPVAVRVSPITDREDLQGYQEQAPRISNETLNEKYQGFIPIPNTPAIFQFNAKPRVDMMWDNQNSGNPDRFVTATIPTGPPNSGGGTQFNVTTRASSLSFDVRAPDVPGDFRFYYNNDFFGPGSGMVWRLKQLYGQFYNVTAGFTFSIFEDPDVWPDTVDFEGPNSMIFARQPTVRYELALSDHWHLNFGLQQPASDIDNEGAEDGASPNNHAPDGGFNVRWEDEKWGHVQFATIFRAVGARGTTLGQQTVLGWGLNLSGNFNIFENDSVQGQFTYGNGIFHFSNDNFTYPGFNGGDAAFNNAGQLEALRYVAPMVAYTHQWCEAFRSTATFGYVNLQNVSGQTAAAYDETYYASANVIWQVRKRLSIGTEALYGYKRENGGAHGDVWRIQTGLVFTLFK
jgi:hypothetical protein